MDDFEVLDFYSRRRALADGVLVDVTRQASPAEMHGGFRQPVAVTATLWAAIEAIPVSLDGIADGRGRLHDVLWMAALAARRCELHRSGGPATFRVILPFRGSSKRLQLLTVHLGPDDDGSPCWTIGFPEDF
jgi:Family of unknown function (DUF6573)